MDAIRKSLPAPGISVEQLDDPQVDDVLNVLVDVEAAGICGGDLHLFDWWPSYRWVASALPVTIGHEFSGRVSAVGPAAKGIAVGDRVTVMPIVGCGECSSCRAGREADCSIKKTLGFTLNGGFARRVVVPARNCLKLPPNVDFDIGALTEPLAIAAHAIRRAGGVEGDVVVILGPGVIGQAIGALALRFGAAKVLLVGKGDHFRLSQAQALGMSDTVDLEETTLESALDTIARGKVDKVFEATGVPSSIDLGLSVLRREGVLVACGIHPAPAMIDITRLVREKHTLVGSINHERQDWETVLSVLSADPESFQPMITHRLDLSEADEAFRLAHDRVASKVLFKPNG